MTYQIENFLGKIIKYGLYAILLTPLALWPRIIYPFLTSKFILFQVLVEIVFAAWLTLAITDKKYRPEFSKLTLAMAGFFAASFISALFGADFHRSLWGIGPRMTGLFGELHFFAWFLVLIGFLGSPIFQNGNNEIGFPRWRNYLNFSFFVAIAAAATTFYTNAQWGLIYGYGIFNNPTFLVPYLIFHFFWGLCQTLNLKSQISNLKKWQRWLFGTGTIFLMAVIFRVQIRGAILGFLLGIFIFGVGLIFSNIFSRRSRILLFAFYFIFFAGLIGLWFLRENPFIQNISPIKRVTGLSLSETTVQTRLLAWKTGLRSVWDRPVFGFGPENFNYLFNAHYNPRSLKFGGGGFNETWFDKPHNAFLEILSETGIAGSLAYVSVWFFAFAALARLFRNDQKLLSITLSGAFVSYFGAMFLAFDSFGSWFGLYLFLAFLAACSSDTNTRIHTNYTNKIISLLLVSLVSISVLVSVYLNYSIWRAGLADADAIRFFYSDPTKGMALFKKSLNYPTPYRAEYQLDMFTAVASALQRKLPIPNPEENINFAIAEGDKMLTAKPNDAFYYTSMAKLYNILGESGSDPQILAWAETYGRKALELTPRRQETMFYLAKTALMKGDAKLAIEWTSQAVDAEPVISMSHWFLGVAYLGDGQNEKGKAEIGKALELGYSPQNQREKDLVKNLGL